MNALSTITIFPSNDKELGNYLQIIKKEILASKDKSIKRQLFYARKSINEILLDPEIKNHLKTI